MTNAKRAGRAIPQGRKPQVLLTARRTGQVLALGAAAAVVAGCGAAAQSSDGTAGQGAAGDAAAAAAKSQNVLLIGKVDADSGTPGTFTGKEHWPAVAPSTIKLEAGAKVTLTIKEYDDMVTELPAGSPYHQVTGGTETVDGKAVTSVGNDQIAHTVTIPALGINIPLPKAPEDGVTTVTFTFTAPASGTYEWRCMTPCGSDPHGMGGAMQKAGWMRGSLTVA